MLSARVKHSALSTSPDNNWDVILALIINRNLCCQNSGRLEVCFSISELSAQIIEVASNP